MPCINHINNCSAAGGFEKIKKGASPEGCS
jgi:hypothetical protein